MPHDVSTDGSRRAVMAGVQDAVDALDEHERVWQALVRRIDRRRRLKALAVGMLVGAGVGLGLRRWRR